jgi:hypothetical protein
LERSSHGENLSTGERIPQPKHPLTKALENTRLSQSSSPRCHGDKMLDFPVPVN